MPGKGQRNALGCAVTAAALSCDIPLGVTEADTEFAWRDAKEAAGEKK